MSESEQEGSSADFSEKQSLRRMVQFAEVFSRL